MKRMKKIIVSVVACAALLVVGMCSVNNVQAATDGYTKDQITDMISNKQAPEETGKLFAGWYTDDSYKTPVTSAEEVTDSTVAKFVDEEVLTVKLQLLASTTAASTVTSVRFVSSVDSRNYQKVSFSVDSTGSVDPVFDADTAYTKIYAGEESYDPSVFSNDSNYVVTYIWEGIGRGVSGVTNDATSNFGKTITVTPSWTTMDGTVVTGKPREFEINDGLYETQIDIGTDTANTENRKWGPLEDKTDATVCTRYMAHNSTVDTCITLLKDIEYKDNGSAFFMTIGKSGYDKTVTIDGQGKTFNIISTCTGDYNGFIYLEQSDLVFKNMTINYSGNRAFLRRSNKQDGNFIRFDDVNFNITGTGTKPFKVGVIYIQDATDLEFVNGTACTVIASETMDNDKAIIYTGTATPITISDSTFDTSNVSNMYTLRLNNNLTLNLSNVTLKSTTGKPIYVASGKIITLNATGTNEYIGNEIEVDSPY